MVDEDGQLIGIVSRRDLLNVSRARMPTSSATSGRSQSDGHGQTRKDVIVEVHHGVVTLTGPMRSRAG